MKKLLLLLISITFFGCNDSREKIDLTDFSDSNTKSRNSQTNYTQNSGINDIENTSISKKQWKSPGDKLSVISKIMIQNNIRGCGEYYISEITNGEFAVACTADGVNWSYYVVYPGLNKIYLASEKMTFEPPY